MKESGHINKNFPLLYKNMTVICVTLGYLLIVIFSSLMLYLYPNLNSNISQFKEPALKAGDVEIGPKSGELPLST